MELFSKKEAELKDVENSQPSYIVKNENAEQNTKGVTKQALDKEIPTDRPSQQQLGTIVQDQDRMTLKAIQRSPDLPLPS